MQRLKSLSLYIFLGLLAYMPLHIFLSTWLGTSFNILSFAKILKDIVLIFGFGIAVIASVPQPWFKDLIKDKLTWLIIAYGLLTIGLALVKPTDTDAELLGIVYNLRFLVFAGYGLLLGRLFDVGMVRHKTVQIVLGVGVAVVLFGVLQYLIIPNNALSHVGYKRDNGVLPAFFIDDKPDLERSMSTLRDPNSLGSYLIIIMAIALVFWLRQRVPRQLGIGLVMLCSLCLLFTFSRSAWLGTIVMGALVLAWQYGAQLFGKYKKQFLLVVAGLVVMVGLLLPLKNTYLVQNVIFHADESTVLEDPNQLRSRFLTDSLNQIKAQPLGRGPGTAGLASIQNDRQGVNLNENYYLQIAVEVGLIGLGLFVAILAVVAWRLWQRAKQDDLALALLASLAGLLVTNFLVHIWSNEAVAYTWWGLAGLVLATPFSRKLGYNKKH